MAQKIFPPYLNLGSKGPAVVVLQIILKTYFEGDGSDFEGVGEVDGIYGRKVAAAVSSLQLDLGLEEDGNFGPQTRAVFKKRSGLDVDELTVEMFSGETIAVMPEGVES